MIHDLELSEIMKSDARNGKSIHEKQNPERDCGNDLVTQLLPNYAFSCGFNT